MKWWKKGKEKDKGAESTSVYKNFADAFEAQLKDRDLHYSCELSDQGDAVFRLPYELNDRLRFMVVVAFTRDETLVSVYVYNYVVNTPESKRKELQEKLNEWNYHYPCYKFYIDSDSDVVVSWSFPFLAVDYAFSAQNTVLFISRLLDMLEKNHPELLKIIDGEEAISSDSDGDSTGELSPALPENGLEEKNEQENAEKLEKPKRATHLYVVKPDKPQ